MGYGFRSLVRRGVVIAVAAVVVSGGSLARAQISAQALIGNAVSDDSLDKEINNAITRFRDRDIDGCRAILERAKSNNPKLPPPGVMMATLWLAVSQLGPAREELENAAVKFPGDPEAYLKLGDLAFGEGRITDSAVLFDKATALTSAFNENPKRKRDFDIRCEAGTAAVAERRKQWEAAEKHLAKWIELDPDTAGSRLRMGNVLFQLGKEKEALEQFREAKKIDKNSPLPEVAMAQRNDEAKKRDAAKKWILDAIKAAPSDAAVQLFAARWYLQQGDFDAAKAAADTALKLDSKSLEAKFVRGLVARVARDYATAEKFLNEAHFQSPGNFDVSNSLALVLIESDDEEARRRALELADTNVAKYRENTPQQIPAVTSLAWVFYKLGRREDAERILEQVRRSNALSSDGAFYVARILVDRGEKDLARKILDEVLANEPMFATRQDAVDLLAKLKKEAGTAAPESK
ncbi:MAG: tetratricopeptide repeat protein [Planctomycetes bacterium]|nr:tetratricopeptide repeat protein [Planctomycetota bacterium]